MNVLGIVFRAVVCGLIYVGFLFLLFAAMYPLELSIHAAWILGFLCAVAITAVSYSKTAKRTVVTMIFGFIAACVAQIFFWYLDMPFKLLEDYFTGKLEIMENGRIHLTVNEIISWGWGFNLFFLPVFLGSFGILLIFVPRIISKRNGRKAEETGVITTTNDETGG